MKAHILVTMNQAEINDALNINDQNAKARNRELQYAEEDRKEYTDVIVPEKKTEQKEIILNPFEVDFMTVGDAGLIYVQYQQKREFNLVFEQDVWDAIEKAIVLKQKNAELQMHDLSGHGDECRLCSLDSPKN